jgi:hypothetical protein
MSKSTELENLLPDPTSLISSAPNIKSLEDVNKVALRRGKVRELMRMGYEAHQIVLFLQKGIKIATGERVELTVSEWTVKNDMDSIKQEDSAIDIDIPGVRAEILDKLKFLYNQAIRQYLDAKGTVKNSFLNTSLAILNKRIELEGLKQPELLDVNVNAEAKVAKFAIEVQQLSEEDRYAIVTTIRKILGKRESDGTGDAGVSGDTPRIPAQASDNEGVSGELELCERSGPTETEE